MYGPDPYAGHAGMSFAASCLLDDQAAEARHRHDRLDALHRELAILLRIPGPCDDELEAVSEALDQATSACSRWLYERGIVS